MDPAQRRDRSPTILRPRTPPGPFTHPGAARRLLNFGVIGATCTVAFAALYSVFRTALGPIEAKLAALSLTMLLNFAANRLHVCGAP